MRFVYCESCGRAIDTYWSFWVDECIVCTLRRSVPFASTRTPFTRKSARKIIARIKPLLKDQGDISEMLARYALHAQGWCAPVQARAHAYCRVLASIFDREGQSIARRIAQKCGVGINVLRLNFVC